MNETLPASNQPSLDSFVQRMGDELQAKAIVVLHENGQVLYRYGWIDEQSYPSMAALVSAMIATGKSLGSLGDGFPLNPLRFACDSEAVGLYTVAVSPEVWMAVLYEQPLNPGQFRMKVRRYSDLLGKLGISKPEQWELANESSLNSGATLSPVSHSTGPNQEILTGSKSSLFGDVSDDEIDQLFENARS